MHNWNVVSILFLAGSHPGRVAGPRDQAKGTAP